MATHSSTLAWRLPWTEEPGGLLSIRYGRKVEHNCGDLAHKHSETSKCKQMVLCRLICRRMVLGSPCLGFAMLMSLQR